MTLALAVIREAECIGCAKCIQACPVDAILGSARSMHTVIADECIGCKLCLPPCPVDCIDLLSGPEEPREKAGQAKKRVLARKERLRNSPENKPLSKALAPEASKNYIQDAIARIKASKIKPV